MFKFVALLALVGIAAAGTTRYNQPQQYNTHAVSSHSSSEEAHAEIQKFHNDVRADGFDYAVETSNGIYVQASGDEHGNIHGEYHYISHEGVPVKVTYVADEHGYQPASDLLPTPPPTPIAILKSLEYIRNHPAKEETSYYGKKH